MACKRVVGVEWRAGVAFKAAFTRDCGGRRVASSILLAPGATSRRVTTEQHSQEPLGKSAPTASAPTLASRPGPQSASSAAIRPPPPAVGPVRRDSALGTRPARTTTHVSFASSF